jgi:Dyp-type peroxidase family
MILDAVPQNQQAIDLSLTVAIDPATSRPMLEKLQGNILKSHGRGHVHLLLLRFTAKPPEVQAWVRSFAANWITSASDQNEEIEAHHRRQDDPTGVFGSLLLTGKGYAALGYSTEAVDTAFDTASEAVPFTRGMAEARAHLHDPDRSSWEAPYKSCVEQPIQAMVMLAANSEGLLNWASQRVERSLAGIGELAGREAGAVMRDEKERSIEPFGFVDGISQPLFFRSDLEREQSRGGNGTWDSLAPLGLVLVQDPFITEESCFGSFLVFRKLEQDVQGFRARLQEVAKTFTGSDEDLAGALVVGRFHDGTPVIAHRSAADADHDFNNFDYFQDPNGSRCPVHSHIRKTNPRRPNSGDKTHRIVRRGIPYEYQELQGGEVKTRVGLLFLCFQASIGNQFAVIQSWADDPGAPSGSPGADPLIGRQPPGFSQHWQKGWDKGVDTGPATSLDFGPYVTLKGGEFFFAPSIPFLRGPMAPAGT